MPSDIPSTSGRTIFVTVGTTKFDELIKAVDSVEFAEAAKTKGYDRIVVQKGAGAYVPHNLVTLGEASATLPSGIEVEFFDYAPSLAERMSAAALVISHAGSGSIFESLTLGKPLIVVPNPLLMDNHQVELGEHLAAMNHLVCATPKNLAEAVMKLDASVLKPYVKGDAAQIVAAISAEVGFAM